MPECFDKIKAGELALTMGAGMITHLIPQPLLMCNWHARTILAEMITKQFPETNVIFL